MPVPTTKVTVTFNNGDSAVIITGVTGAGENKDSAGKPYELEVTYTEGGVTKTRRFRWETVRDWLSEPE